MNSICVPEGITYSNYKAPVVFASEGFELSFSYEDNIYRYKRVFGQNRTEKSIISESPELIISPVEPIFPERKIAPFLYIDFEQNIEVEPDSSYTVFCIVPVNLGIFISSGKNTELIDIISFSPEKYALYGDPAHGVVGRYAKSRIYGSKPDFDCLLGAVLELNLINSSGSWIEVSKAVFNATQMRMYYNHKDVYLKARMRVLNQMIAETDFEDVTIEGFKRSLEIYRQKKFLISLDGGKYLMDAGV